MLGAELRRVEVTEDVGAPYPGVGRVEDSVQLFYHIIVIHIVSSNLQHSMIPTLGDEGVEF